MKSPRLGSLPKKPAKGDGLGVTVVPDTGNPPAPASERGWNRPGGAQLVDGLSAAQLKRHPELAGTRWLDLGLVEQLEPGPGAGFADLRGIAGDGRQEFEPRLPGCSCPLQIGDPRGLPGGVGQRLAVQTDRDLAGVAAQFEGNQLKADRWSLSVGVEQGVADGGGALEGLQGFRA